MPVDQLDSRLENQRPARILIAQPFAAELGLVLESLDQVILCGCNAGKVDLFDGWLNAPHADTTRLQLIPYHAASRQQHR